MLFICLFDYCQSDYGCSFVAKLSWKKKFFFGKIFVFFTKYTLFAEKNVFIWKKKFYIENFFYWIKNFFAEKNINENVKIYISFEKYILVFVCVTNKI